MDKKVLIVDDTAFARTLIKEMLKKIGITHIYEGATGAEAVHLYRTYRPDLVTMDIVMPEMDGLEALKEITSFDSEANVIMCSARGQKDLVVAAYANGAKDFIVKPFAEERLLETIRRCV